MLNAVPESDPFARDMFSALLPHRAFLDSRLSHIASTIMLHGAADVVLQISLSDKGQPVNGTDWNTRMYVTTEQGHGKSGQGIATFGFTMVQDDLYGGSASCTLTRVNLTEQVRTITDSLTMQDGRLVRHHTQVHADGTIQERHITASPITPLYMARTIGTYALALRLYQQPNMSTTILNWPR
ncbi:hypothetical protein JNM87_06240 [Candidatus Saccharibacteria bacterium]|nr:hypothetical protein [Candidatus Saccharibacteria bacterium]